MTNQVILITGASSGIGQATAQHLAGLGYRVFGTSRQPHSATSQDFPLLQLDVRSNDSVRACVDDLLSQTGRIDILINNAGIGLFGALEESSLEEARALFEINFFGVMRMCKAILPIMRQQQAGRIINISSIAGLIGVPYQGIYSASKFALEGYSETLRHEVKQFGIHVSLIEPGDIHTDIVEEHTVRRISEYAATRETVYQDHMKSMRSAPPPSVVARLIEKVISSRRPRLRYSVGRESYVPVARRLLPLSVGEWIIRRYFKLDQ